MAEDCRVDSDEDEASVLGQVLLKLAVLFLKCYGGPFGQSQLTPHFKYTILDLDITPDPHLVLLLNQ